MTRNYNPRILVVDDQKTNRDIVTFFLRQAGYSYFAEASTGPEALQQAQTFHPDLILLDVVIPELNGFEVCQKLKDDPATSHIPVLFLSGLTDVKNRTIGYQLGAVDFINKPVDRHELLARLNIHLNHHQLLRELEGYRARVAQELDQARDLQLALLPSPQELQDIGAAYSLAVSHHYQPSLELAGDLWGLYPLPNEHVAFMLLDCTGHGVSAALNAMRCHTLIQEHADLLLQPELFLTTLDDKLSRTLPPGSFITVCGGLIDTRQRLLHTISAGGPGLLSITPKGVELIACAGQPLGLGRGGYTTEKYALQPGQTLLAYSDALTEARHQNGKRWLTQGVIQAVKQYGLSAATLSSFMGHFLATAEALEDDLTALAITLPTATN